MVVSKEVTMIGAHDLLNRELYTLADASRITGIPASTVSWWCRGRGHHKPAVRDTAHAELDVRWGDLVSLFYLKQLRDLDVDLDSIRNFVTDMHESSESAFPLATIDVYTNGAKVAWKVADGFEDTTGHVFSEAMHVDPFVRRVDFDDEGIVAALRPSDRHPNVQVAALVRLGAPQIDGFSTKPLADVFYADFAAAKRAGRPVDRAELERGVARDHGLRVAQLREAVSFEDEIRQREPAIAA